jgi:hypothetical protein
MKQLKLKIEINESADNVFEFCLNPKNTPKWIDGIIKEKTNEWPTKLGTIYKNTSDGKVWNEYKLTEFDKGKMFVMTAKDGKYHVKYTLTPKVNNSCELEYFEWVEKGELISPFNIQILQKLKELIEK